MALKLQRSSVEPVDLMNKAIDTIIEDSIIADEDVLTALKTLKNLLDGKLNNNANAVSASKLATSRTISLTGDVTGSASFDGSANISMPSTVANNSHTHTSSNISDATNVNTANMIVKRDGSGNFSAGTITASLSGNASTATKLKTSRTIAGVSFDGSANINISYENLTNKPTIPEGVVVNNTLTSTSTTQSLSANQGRILKGLVDNAQDDVNNKLLIQSTEPTTQNKNDTWLQQI